MNVAMISSSVSRLGGGLFTSVRRLGQALEAQGQGLSVHVLSTTDPYVSEDIGVWHPLDVRVHGATGPWGFRYSPGIGSDLRSENFDLVHVQHLWMYPSVATLGWHRRTKRPYVVSPRGMIDAWAMQQARAKKWLAWHAFEQSHLARASCIHALGASEVDGIRRSGIRTPVCVIPNGIDIPDAAASSTRAEEPPRLLFLGRLHPKKGIGALLSAWRDWKRAGAGTAHDWRLVLAGFGEAEDVESFKRIARELEIEESVDFPGPAYGAEKQRLFETATAFVLPSFSEGLPMAVLEAWSYRLPALITPQCNLQRGVDRGAALSIDPDALSIRQGLASLAAMTDTERDAMGARGLDLVRREFSWSTVAAQMKELYDWSLGAGPAPASMVRA